MSINRINASPTNNASWIAVCAAGLLSLGVALGVGRFAFTPLLPLMVRADQLDVGTGGWLAVINHVGYLLGSLTAARLPLSSQRLGLVGLACIAFATAAMGFTHALPWWLLWRFVAGVASAWVLVSTSVWCLARLSREGRAGGQGLVFSGTGVGIAFAGLLCWGTRSTPETLWWELGASTLVIACLVAVLTPREHEPAQAPVPQPVEPLPDPGLKTGVPLSLVIHYGLMGFGYVVPATFLPVLARAVVDDPAWFGAAWPVFGAAAAVSAGVAGWAFKRVRRTRLMAGAHALLALGCVLPVLHLSLASVLASSLLVGGTFMVATLAGLQEARRLAQGNPTRTIGFMTAAFAVGQLTGPLMPAILIGRSGGNGHGLLFLALAVAAATLAGSALWLLRRPPA